MTSLINERQSVSQSINYPGQGARHWPNSRASTLLMLFQSWKRASWYQCQLAFPRYFT